MPVLQIMYRVQSAIQHGGAELINARVYTHICAVVL